MWSANRWWPAEDEWAWFKVLRTPIGWSATEVLPEWHEVRPGRRIHICEAPALRRKGANYVLRQLLSIGLGPFT